MATIRDVAEQAGVSAATVSHVINGTREVSPQTIEAVRVAMRELDYTPSSVARSLRTRRTDAVGVLISDISNPFFASLVRGVEEAAYGRGFSVMICDSSEDSARAVRAIDLFRSRGLDGYLVVPTAGGGRELALALRASGKPFVCVDRCWPEVGADRVLSDNVGGARQATEYLVQRGHSDIGIILGIPNTTTTEERLQGYREALQEAGIPLREDLVVWGHYVSQEAYAVTERLLSVGSPPTAVFSTNNLMTIGALRFLVEHDIEVPGQVEVVGFDDLDWGLIVRPPLVVLVQNPYEMGLQAFGLLHRRMEESGRTPREEYAEIRVPVKLRADLR